jgi:hypothetical protein
MTARYWKNRPRLAAALQLALLICVFQGVVATTPSTPGTRSAYAPGFLASLVALSQPQP